MKPKRIWELDSARGIAIIMMIVSNLFLDLHLFTGMHFPQEGLWLYFARLTAAAFIFIAGISLTVSFSRSRGFKKYLKRGLRVLGWGVLITIASYIMLPESFIVFGILHMIGVGIILSYPLLNKKVTALVLGLTFIAVGILITGIRLDFPWLLWLGFTYHGFSSVDFVPLLPWFGVMLLGIFTGNLLFPKGKGFLRKASVPIKLLSALGRRSLFIYLVHQPVIVGLILLFS